MNAIVTGSSGFLAKQLICRLHDEGWHVTQVGRNSKEGTLSWEQFLEFDLHEIDVVFHMAAFIPPSMEESKYAEDCLRANALLTLKAAEHTAKFGKTKFVHTSTGQIYRLQSEPADEDTPLDVTRRACFYLSSKILGETYLQRCCQLSGLRAVIFRLGSCYGAGMSETALISKFIRQASMHQDLTLIHGGVEKLDLVWSQDVVELLVRAALSDHIGVFNAGSGAAINVKKISQIVTKACQSPSKIHLLGEEASPKLQGFTPLDIRKARQAFDWHPVCFEEGLARHLRTLASDVSLVRIH